MLPVIGTNMEILRHFSWLCLVSCTVCWISCENCENSRMSMNRLKLCNIWRIHEKNRFFFYWAHRTGTLRKKLNKSAHNYRKDIYATSYWCYFINWKPRFQFTNYTQFLKKIMSKNADILKHKNIEKNRNNCLWFINHTNQRLLMKFE